MRNQPGGGGDTWGLGSGGYDEALEGLRASLEARGDARSAGVRKIIETGRAPQRAALGYWRWYETDEPRHRYDIPVAVFGRLTGWGRAGSAADEDSYNGQIRYVAYPSPSDAVMALAAALSSG